MRFPAPLFLVLLAGCTATLYSRYAGPAAGNVDEAYGCVQAKLKELGYERSQYNSTTHWYVAKKVSRQPNSSGLYRQTSDVLDTQIDSDKEGQVILNIKARTYEQYATAKNDDLQEEKASDRVQIDAQKLGQACAAK